MSEIAERCAPFEADLSALLDEQLDAPRAGEVQAHAASCRDCAHRLVALRTVNAALLRVAAAPTDPARIDAMRGAIASQLRDEARPAARPPLARRAPARRRHWIAAAALSATAAAAGALLLVTRAPTPVPAPASGVVATKQAAATSRADAEVAAHDLAAAIDTPIGANTPPDDAAPTAGQLEATRDESVDVIALVTNLSPQTRDALRAKIAALAPEARSRLLLDLSRRQELSPQQRNELHERLAQLGVLSPEEQERALR